MVFSLDPNVHSLATWDPVERVIQKSDFIPKCGDHLQILDYICYKYSILKTRKEFVFASVYGVCKF